MADEFTFDKPIRFASVQDKDHARYRPKLVGSFLNQEGERRWVVVARNWDHALSYITYDETGKVLGDCRDATRSSGILNPQLVNGDPITEHVGTINGVEVVVTFDGDEPKQVRIVK